MNAKNDLNQQLARQADDFFRRGGTELEIGQVVARAGEIRRGRRLRATVLMAACLMAIAAPTALVAMDRGGDEQPQPLQRREVNSAPITLGDLKTGDQPHDGYAVNGSWDGAGSLFPLAERGYRLSQVATFAGGLLASVQDMNGESQARLVDPTTGEVAKTWPLASGLAVSDGGHVVAFVRPDGTPVVVQAAEQGGRPESFELSRIPGSGALEPVAVAGEDCSDRAGADCAVWVTSKGEVPAAWVARSDGTLERVLPAMSFVSDVRDGVVAGMTEVTDEGSCSEVRRVDGTGSSWSTCTHRLLAFSPDGKHLLASGAYASGIGDSQLAVLDSSDGSVVLDLRTQEQGFVAQMEWEDDSHLLATVFESGRWAVLRIGLDGEREYATAPRRGEDVDPVYQLPVR